MLIPKREAYPGEKCPFCLQIFVNFLKVDDITLGCLKCGAVFIGKEQRTYLAENQAKILKEQAKLVELPVFRCDCGFEAKNGVGLAAHERHCKVLMEREYESGSSGN